MALFLVCDNFLLLKSKRQLRLYLALCFLNLYAAGIVYYAFSSKFQTKYIQLKFLKCFVAGA